MRKKINIKRYTKGFRRHSGLEFRYDEINRKFFKGKLPPVRCGFSPRLGETYAVTVIERKTQKPICIMINKAHRSWHDTAVTSLIHEMIHVKYPKHHGHGKYFKKERRRLILAGAFDPLI